MNRFDEAARLFYWGGVTGGGWGGGGGEGVGEVGIGLFAKEGRRHLSFKKQLYLKLGASTVVNNFPFKY